jgi:hypothetical protein
MVAAAPATSWSASSYDAAVSGADPIADRPGFKAMLDRMSRQRSAGETASRFARDLMLSMKEAGLCAAIRSMPRSRNLA